MWIFTTFGFFSIVEDRDDSDRLLVRARVRNDLVEFVNRMPNSIPILYSPAADYPYRIFVNRVDVQSLVADAVAEIDYDNFKDRVQALQGTIRHDAYLSVWSVLRDLQRSVSRVLGVQRRG